MRREGDGAMQSETWSIRSNLCRITRVITELSSPPSLIPSMFTCSITCLQVVALHEADLALGALQVILLGVAYQMGILVA